MTQIRAAGIDAGVLGERMSGPVLVAGTLGYAQARAIWNGDIDHYPAARAACPRLMCLR